MTKDLIELKYLAEEQGWQYYIYGTMRKPNEVDIIIITSCGNCLYEDNDCEDCIRCPHATPEIEERLKQRYSKTIREMVLFAYGALKGIEAIKSMNDKVNHEGD